MLAGGADQYQGGKRPEKTTCDVLVGAKVSEGIEVTQGEQCIVKKCAACKEDIFIAFKQITQTKRNHDCMMLCAQCAAILYQSRRDKCTITEPDEDLMRAAREITGNPNITKEEVSAKAAEWLASGAPQKQHSTSKDASQPTPERKSAVNRVKKHLK